MNNIIFATLISVVLLGAFFGIGLALAARKFKVAVDPRVEGIENVLPGVNCGACGFTGCKKFAQAIALGQTEVDGCTVGGSETADKVAAIMGVDSNSEKTVRQIALVRCQGDRNRARNLSEYRGISSCAGAELVEGGSKGCAYGCLGLGDCVRACPFNAIEINSADLPVVDERLCTGCKKCVAACPRRIISMIEDSSKAHVLCMSEAKGAEVRKVCEVGCISCKRCVKVCPADAIRIEKYLAIIDYDKCRNCGLCIKECPNDVIVRKQEEARGRIQESKRQEAIV